MRELWIVKSLSLYNEEEMPKANIMLWIVSGLLYKLGSEEAMVDV